MKNFVLAIFLCLVFSGCSCIKQEIKMKSFVVTTTENEKVLIQAASYKFYTNEITFYSDSCECDKVATFRGTTVKRIEVSNF